MATALAVVAATLSACEQESPFEDAVSEPTSLVASPAFVQSGEGVQARLASLQQAIDRLRTSTGSGWVGRQDDLTGYLAELSGGRFTGTDGGDTEAAAESLMSEYGLDLFGVSYADLELGEVSAPDITGTGSVRATQVVEGVPVVDGELVMTVADPEGAAGVTAVRGRVFPGLDVATEPQLGARQAARSAKRLSGGDVVETPSLVIVPDNGGTLAWQVVIFGSEAGGSTGDSISLSDGRYFISAENGELLMLRPTTAERTSAVALLPRGVRRTIRFAAADPNSVEVTGPNPLGGELTAIGLRTPDGVALVDTTVPTYDDATGDGAIVTYTAQDTEKSPGRLYVERPANGTRISDPEAIAAQAMSRAVYDYYASLGRRSWDNANGTLLSTVNYSDSTFCNSYFNGEQMIYGNPCADQSGPAEVSEVEIDTAGHEITHGVINTSSNLVYSGQPGALNESFADYFGNVIGNKYKNTDSVAIFEGGCTGFTDATSMCNPNPDGSLSLRYMLNGATYDDYLRLLTPTFRLDKNFGYDADNGGVHLNSAIWNNALWSIRSRLAKIENKPGNDSQLATDFDKIVYAALTNQLTPASGFLDARAAIEKTIVDAGADAKILDVAREVFDLNHICEGCVDVGPVNGSVVSRAPQTQIEPVVSGDDIAWVDLSQGGHGVGVPARGKVDGDASALASQAETTQVAFAGTTTLAMDMPETGDGFRVVRYDESGAAEEIDRVGASSLLAGLAGSAEGAAWVSLERGTVSFLDPTGQLTEEDLPDLGGATVTALGTGQGNVALGTESGQVILWQPGNGFTQLGQITGSVVSLAAYGSRALAVDDAGNAVVMDGNGASVAVSGAAGMFGAAMNDEYAVWSEQTGQLTGGLAEIYTGLLDTDLYLYSFRTGTIYNLLAQTGQQGYPSISGDRLVWQDTVFGNNDIFTAPLPSGL